MSDAMFYGILRMPYEMAMEGEISRFQFWSTAQAAANRVEILESEVERLRGISNDLDRMRGSSFTYQRATPELKAHIDAQMKIIDARIAERHESRDRRKAESGFEGENKRVADRRHSER